MKRLILYIYLIFISISVHAYGEDISNFEIDGISIGESALKYFNEKEILKEIEENAYMYDYLKDPKKFGHVVVRQGLTDYSFVILFVSLNNKYTIEGVSGTLNQTIVSKNDLQKCLKKMKEVEEVFSQIFNKYDKFEDVGIHPIDSTGRSKVHYIKFTFQTGDSAQTECYDFEEELRMKNNWVDGLSVTVRKKEVRNWLTNRK